MNATAQECADRQDDRGRLENEARDRDDAPNPFTLDDQIGRLLLEQGQIRLVLQCRADRLAIELAIGLCTGRADGRTLAGIEYAELDSGHIGGPGHRAPQGIDFPHEVTLSDATDGGIAAHLPQRLDALGEEKRTRAHARGRQRGLGAGVAAANDNYVKRASETHE